MMRRSGIYKIYWINSNYYYIGQSCDLKSRYKKHLRLLDKQTHENKKIQNVFNKYGTPLFQELEICELSLLDEREQFYLTSCINDENCCNLCPIASSTKGYKHSEETKKLIGQLSKKKVFTEEYKQKLRNRKPNLTMLNKFHSEETKMKMSISRKGKDKTEEHKIKISESNKLKNRLNQRSVKNTETGEVFNSIREAARFYNVDKGTINNRIKSKNFPLINI